MSERERWIVYPLLFLSLGVSLRDKLSNRTWSENVLCERLVLMDSSRGSLSEPTVLGWLGAVEDGSVPVRPGGYLSIDAVRAGTVIAEDFACRGISFTLRDLLQALGRSANRANPGDSAREALDAAAGSTEAEAELPQQSPADD